jgi:hypothetical protein
MPVERTLAIVGVGDVKVLSEPRKIRTTDHALREIQPPLDQRRLPGYELSLDALKHHGSNRRVHERNSAVIADDARLLSAIEEGPERDHRVTSDKPSQWSLFDDRSLDHARPLERNRSIERDFAVGGATFRKRRSEYSLSGAETCVDPGRMVG